MNQIIPNPKLSNSRKHKASIFRQNPTSQKFQLKKLLDRLSQSYEANQQQKIVSILESRDRKLTQMRKRKSKYVWQNPIVVSSSRENFSKELPISSGQKFLSEKVRQNILAPDKMYNKQPNMRSGSVDQSKIINYSREDDPRVVNKKFEQFVRIINEQSGANKRKKYSQGGGVKEENRSLPTIKSTYKLTMKRTYFKKYPSNQYNFYKPPITQISRVQKIFQLTKPTTHRQSTQQSRQKSREMEKSRQSLSRNYDTLELKLNLSRQKSINFNLNTNAGTKTLDAYRSN